MKTKEEDKKNDGLINQLYKIAIGRDLQDDEIKSKRAELTKLYGTTEGLKNFLEAEIIKDTQKMNEIRENMMSFLYMSRVLASEDETVKGNQIIDEKILPYLRLTDEITKFKTIDERKLMSMKIVMVL